MPSVITYWSTMDVIKGAHSDNFDAIKWEKDGDFIIFDKKLLVSFDFEYKILKFTWNKETIDKILKILMDNKIDWLREISNEKARNEIIKFTRDDNPDMVKFWKEHNDIEDIKTTALTSLNKDYSRLEL